MNRGKHLFIYKDRLFVIDDCVQGPDDYSLFFEESIVIEDGEVALDLATGSGFIAVMLAARASRVVGVDISASSVRCAELNVLLNHVEHIVEVREGDLFDAIAPNECFDLIVAWPPVLPTRPSMERNDWFGIANEGGPDGRLYIDRIIGSASRFLRPHGRLQILQPWYTDPAKSISMLISLGFQAQITADAEFPVGSLSFERATYLAELGFPLVRKDGRLVQRHAVITARWD